MAQLILEIWGGKFVIGHHLIKVVEGGAKVPQGPSGCNLLRGAGGSVGDARGATGAAGIRDHSQEKSGILLSLQSASEEAIFIFLLSLVFWAQIEFSPDLLRVLRHRIWPEADGALNGTRALRSCPDQILSEWPTRRYRNAAEGVAIL